MGQQLQPEEETKQHSILPFSRPGITFCVVTRSRWFDRINNCNMLFLKICVMVSILARVSAQWGYSTDQIEVYDLADEFKGNFYEFLEISSTATTSEIRRAYRKLSLVMHPDKNKTEGAEENFRTLAAIYEVLKTKEKREIYDEVLVNGIPSAYLYVPKPLRKMSMTEVSIIIGLILTLGHYFILWGSYIEKWLVQEELMPRLRKKKQKIRRKGQADALPNEEDIANNLEKPKFQDILPIAIARGLYFLVKFLPSYIKEKKEESERQKEELQLLAEEEERNEELRQTELKRREEQKALRKQRAKAKREEMLQYVETSVKEEGNFYSPFESGGSIEELEDMYDSSDGERKPKQKKSWTSNNEAQLIKLMSKYPVGSSQRWHKIADEMDIDVSEVIKRAKQMKGNIGTEDTSKRQKMIGSDKVKCDTFKNMATVRHPENQSDCSKDDSSDLWTSDQQKLFEMALRQFPKGTPERWDKVAKCVPSKSKEECVLRYKELAQMVSSKQKHHPNS